MARRRSIFNIFPRYTLKARIADRGKRKLHRQIKKALIPGYGTRGIHQLIFHPYRHAYNVAYDRRTKRLTKPKRKRKPTNNGWF